MNITVRAAQLDASEIQLGDLMSIQELHLRASGLTFEPRPGGPITAAEISATLVVTEASLNRVLAGAATEGVRDLEIATLTGKIRISGRYAIFGRLPIPFAVTAVPEIEGGARLRLNPSRMTLISAPLPGFSVPIIGERINERLAKAFDTTRLPIPLRLTGVTVEPGRLHLSGTTSLDIRPRQVAVAVPDTVVRIAEGEP